MTTHWPVRFRHCLRSTFTNRRSGPHISHNGYHVLPRRKSTANNKRCERDFIFFSSFYERTKITVEIFRFERVGRVPSCRAAREAAVI